MSVSAWFSGSDQFKGDSTDGLKNGDRMSFMGAGATIATPALLAPGGTKISIDPSANKAQVYARIVMAENTYESQTAFCLVFVAKVVGTSGVATMTDKEIVCSDINNLNTLLRIDTGKNGASTTTVLWKFLWDNRQVGGNQTLTNGNVYRIGVYLKYSGNLATADSTMRVYIDDVTSADIVKATQVISSDTVTVDNNPTLQNNLYFGTSFGGNTYGTLTYEFQHGGVISDFSAGGAPSRATNPAVLVTQPNYVSGPSFPTAQGASNQWTVSGTWANLGEAPPDDDTSFVEGTIATGGAAKDTTYTMTQWSSVGLSTTRDEILAVRVAARKRELVGVGSGAMATTKTIIRDGGANTVSASEQTAVTTYRTNAPGWPADGGLAIQQVPPTSTGPWWTIALYNAAEAGEEMLSTNLVGVDTDNVRITQVRMDAFFTRTPTPPRSKRPALIVAGEQQQAARGFFVGLLSQPAATVAMPVYLMRGQAHAVTPPAEIPAVRPTFVLGLAQPPTLPLSVVLLQRIHQRPDMAPPEEARPMRFFQGLLAQPVPTTPLSVALLQRTHRPPDQLLPEEGRASRFYQGLLIAPTPSTRRRHAYII